MRISASVFSLFFLSIAALANFQTQAPAKFSGLVILEEQADLSGADKLATPAQKGRYVYDALRAVALKSQTNLVRFLNSRHANFERFYIENMIALYDATPDLIQQVAARSDVAEILDNPEVRLSHPKTLPLWEARIATSGPEQNIVSTGATRVWSDFKDTGQGIVIGAQDTGVQWDHPALKSHYRGFDGKSVNHDYNWHDSIHRAIVGQPGPCGLSSPIPCDDYGHGTHTLGTMVGDDGQGNQIGMAPGAKWMACKNMDQGVGRPSTYIECFEWFLAPYPIGGNSMTDGDPSKAPNVINNSWGCLPEEGCSGADLLPAIQAVEKAGIMVVASAGNDGPDCSTIDDAPAIYSGASFTVGAYDHRTGMIAEFSSRGPSRFDGGIGPDISAPGVGIRSSVPGNDYEEDDGTSMAGPHVVGAVALLWSADPKLIGDLATTKQILESTADPAATSESCGGVAGSAVPNNTFGYGLLDVYHAVHASLE